MSSKSRTAAPKMTAKEKKAAQEAAYRKARMQWYALGGFLAVAAIVTIVLISIYTEGSLPQGVSG